MVGRSPRQRGANNMGRFELAENRGSCSEPSAYGVFLALRVTVRLYSGMQRRPMNATPASSPWRRRSSDYEGDGDGEADKKDRLACQDSARIKSFLAV